MQNRLKSWNLWLSIGCLIVFVAKQFFNADIQEEVNNLLNVALPVLIGLGIVNNPTSKDTI